MSVSKVDQKYRIIIEHRLRKKVKIKPGDMVLLEPMGNSSFRVSVVNPEETSIEDDPAWKAIHTVVRAKKRIPPDRLHKFMEEGSWES